jgi:predicted RNase H-like HicB family nuclease
VCEETRKPRPFTPTRKRHPAHEIAAEAGNRVEFRVRAMKRDFNVVVERDREGYYVASIPDLPGCHTQAKSLDELMERIREAAELCLDVQGKELEGLEFIGVQRLTLA